MNESLVSDLVSVWKEIPLERAPYALHADLDVLTPTKHCLSVSSLENFLSDHLGDCGNKRLHLGLIPIPYIGDLTAADIFILMLNPGFHPGDYFAEYRIHEFRAAIISNLCQEPDREFPLFCLDPRFVWTTGASYWRRRLGWLAMRIVQVRSSTYREALSELAKRICILQLVPYHSAAFGLSRRIINRLQSASLIRRYVRDFILPQRDLLILVTRSRELWGLPTAPNILTFSGSETRAVHLSPRSRGGQALAHHLGLPTA
jgi:hypothetical protein